MGVFLEEELELDDLSLVLSGIDDVLSRTLKASKNTRSLGEFCVRVLY